MRKFSKEVEETMTPVSEFQIENNVVLKYLGESSHVFIPEGVETIGESAFSGNKTLVSVILAPTVVDIRENAFFTCVGLESVFLPVSLKVIRDMAFMGCTNLKKVHLPEGLEHLGRCAFGKTGLESVAIPQTITEFSGSFYGCEDLEVVHLSDHLLYIGESAFQFCISLEEIALPDSLERIGPNAFANCDKLEKIIVNDPQFSFESSTFSHSPLENIFAEMQNKNLGGAHFGFTIHDDTVLLEFTDFDSENVVVPEGIMVIVEEAFQGKYRLQSLVLPDGLEYIGKECFLGCDSLKEVNIPTTVQSIGADAFEDTLWFQGLSDEFVIVGDGILIKYNGNDEKIVVPSGVKMIISSMFSDEFYDSVVEIELPDTIEVLGEECFMCCSALKKINLPDSLTRLEERCFDSCASLEKITLPAGLETIPQGLFDGCTSLREIEIPSTIKVIESLAFHETLFWEALQDEFVVINDILLKYNGEDEKIIIPDGVKKIAGAVFKASQFLQEVIVQESVVEIGSEAFALCKNLKTVTFSHGLEFIGEHAFRACSLTSITLPDSVMAIEKGAFAYCDQLEQVHFSTSLEVIGENAFIKCTSLTKITIPASVEVIANCAFAQCSRLDDVTLLDEEILIVPNVFEETALSLARCESLYRFFNEHMGQMQDEEEEEEEEEDIFGFPLFTCSATLEEVAEILKKNLSELVESVEKRDEVVVFSLKDTTSLYLEEPDFQELGTHFDQVRQGLLEGFSEVSTENDTLKQQVLAQISQFQSAFYVSFDEIGIEKRFHCLVSGILAILNELDGLAQFNPDKLLNGDGALVLDLEGNSELEGFSSSEKGVLAYPDLPPFSVEDQARFQRSKEILKKHGIPMMAEEMNLALRMDLLQVRKVEEVVERILALFSLAVYSECLLREEVEDERAQQELDYLDEHFGIQEFFTEDEQEFLRSDEFYEVEAMEYSWGYEQVAILMWALSLYQGADFPDDLCHVRKLSKKIRRFGSVEEMISSSSLRSVEELLQEQDLMFRYLWACRECRLTGREVPADLNEGVVQGRLKALNWLLTTFYGRDWDDVDTPA